jgi:hypothetical protein
MKKRENDVALIVKECELALDAIGRLNFATVNLNRLTRGSRQYNFYFKEVFDSINDFLEHASLIYQRLSQTIPSVDETDNTRPAQCRQKKLWSMWKMRSNGRNILNDRRLLNYVCHPIEAGQTANFCPDDRHFVVGYNTTHLPDQGLCLYNPLARSYAQDGQVFDIGGLTSEIYQFLMSARHELDNPSSFIENRRPAQLAPCTERQIIGALGKVASMNSRRVPKRLKHGK